VKGAIKEAKLSASDVVLVDTAGRLHIDDDLMNELEHAEERIAAQRDAFHRGFDDRAGTQCGRRANSTNGWGSPG